MGFNLIKTHLFLFVILFILQTKKSIGVLIQLISLVLFFKLLQMSTQQFEKLQFDLLI